MTPRRPVPAALALALAAACASAGTAARRPVPGEPSFPDLDKSYRHPTPEDPLCLNTQLAEKVPTQTPGRVVVKFPVDPAGFAGPVTVVADTTGVSPTVLKAMEESIRVCKWAPGRDPQERSVQVLVVLPIDFLETPTPGR